MLLTLLLICLKHVITLASHNAPESRPQSICCCSQPVSLLWSTCITVVVNLYHLQFVRFVMFFGGDFMHLECTVIEYTGRRSVIFCLFGYCWLSENLFHKTNSMNHYRWERGVRLGCSHSHTSCVIGRFLPRHLTVEGHTTSCDKTACWFFVAARS